MKLKDGTSMSNIKEGAGEVEQPDDYLNMADQNFVSSLRWGPLFFMFKALSQQLRPE